MALNFSNIKQTPLVNTSFAMGGTTTPAQKALSGYTNPPLISPPVGSKSVGAVGTKGGYDTAVGTNPVKKVENKNTGITTHYDTATTVKKAPEQNTASYYNPNANYFGEMNQQPVQATQSPQATPVQNSTPNQNTYGGLISLLTSKATDTSNIDKANQALLDLRKRYATEVGNIESQPIPLQFQQGRTQVLGRQFATQESAAQQALNNEITARGQTLNALGSAAGLAAPVQLPYSNQYVDPATGQTIGSTGGSLDTAVQNVASKLRSGQMTYSDALQALSGYGQGGVNALQQALPEGFNIAQSNTLGGQQGSINVNYQLADTALKNVENIMTQLMGGQTTNIPLINKGVNWLSTQFGIGSEQTRAMTGAVQSLRNAYASLLASAKGGTPTDYSSQAIAEIPNEPTPNDIQAIRHNFEVLGKARANILGNPGLAGNTSGQYNW